MRPRAGCASAAPKSSWVAPVGPGPLVLAARPEGLVLAETGIPAEVTGVEFLGSVQRLRARAAGQSIVMDRFNAPTAALPAPGETVHLCPLRSHWMVLAQPEAEIV